MISLNAVCHQRRTHVKSCKNIHRDRHVVIFISLEVALINNASGAQAVSR
jgi:hypothetical protein